MITVGQLARLAGSNVPEAHASIVITGAAALSEAGPGDVSFFSNPKYLPQVRKTRAAAVFVPKDFNDDCPAAVIRVDNPSLAFDVLLRQIAPEPIKYPPGIHPTAVIGQNVQLGREVCIQAYVVIEDGAVIGDRTVIGAQSFVGYSTAIGSDCCIYPRVTIRERARIGNRVIVHSGTVIGSDGFGYEFKDGRHVKIPQTGIVQIDDDVEIGANTTIDRARFGRTWIQEGVKIDNLVQVAHNVVIGRHSVLVAQAGVSGSSKLGNYVTLAGQVGIVGHVEIGDRAIIAAQSGVSKNVPPQQVWFGTPATPINEAKERIAQVARLSKLVKRVRKLEQDRTSDAVKD